MAKANSNRYLRDSRTPLLRFSGFYFMSFLFFLFLLVGTPCFGNTITEAETVRLRSEMKMLAKRDAWTGVDRAFRAADAIQPNLTFDDYLLGAFAAQALGDVHTTRQRLLTAHTLQEDKTVLDWLWNIDTEYVFVHLASKSTDTLIFLDSAFHPQTRTILEFAQGTLGEEGIFEGYLPSGTYTLGDFTFDVDHESGPIRIDTRLDRKTHSPRRLTSR